MQLFILFKPHKNIIGEVQLLPFCRWKQRPREVKYRVGQKVRSVLSKNKRHIFHFHEELY